MSSLLPPSPPPLTKPGRCFGCFRPQEECFCASIPRIANQTEVLILQHRREQFHPFNTARIVHKALQKSRLLITHTRTPLATFPFQPGAGILYPGPGALSLDDLPADQRPTQLVILDGTWHHAKTFLRDIPALQTLPRFQLSPTSPSRYRIRREPTAESLSTIEATVAALRALEPQTTGLEQLLDAFDQMVDRQLAHPKASSRYYHQVRRPKNTANVPQALWQNLDNVVIAYGESSSAERGNKRIPRPPVYWVAERLSTGERFACTITPEVPLTDTLLQHWELSREHFANAVPLEQARAAWQAFQKPQDQLVVYNPSTEHLLSYLDSGNTPCLVLKSVDLQPELRHKSLDERLAAANIPLPLPHHPGRAGQRLANLRAFTQHLHSLKSS